MILRSLLFSALVAAQTIPPPQDHAGQALSTDGKDLVWTPMVGFQWDVSGWKPDGMVYGELNGNNLWTGHQYYPASPTQNLSAPTDRVICNRRTIAISSAAVLTLTSAIPPGVDGQVCVLQNIGTQSVTVSIRGTATAIAPASQTRIQYSLAVRDWIPEGTPSAPVTPPTPTPTPPPVTRYCKLPGWAPTSSTDANNSLGHVTITDVGAGGMIRVSEWLTKQSSNGTFTSNLKIGNVSVGIRTANQVFTTIYKRTDIMIPSAGSIGAIETAYQLGSSVPQMQMASGPYDTSGGSLTLDFVVFVDNPADAVTHNEYCIEYLPAGTP